TAGSDGTWSCVPTTPLPEGEHTLSVTATDPAGNTSDVSDPITITVKTIPPDAPVITEPAEGDWVNTNTPKVAGENGEPGSTITVSDEDGNVLCTATAGSDGTWSCVPTTPLPEGEHTLSVTATDPAGNTSDVSDPITITVKTTPPRKPIVNDPEKPFGIDDPIIITGSGEEEGNEIIIRDENGDTVCTTKVGPAPDFAWTCEFSVQPEDGVHELSVVEKDKAGNESDPSVVEIEVITIPPTDPIVDPTNGSKVSGKGDPGSTITVTDQDGNPVPGCTDVKVDSSGKFLCVPQNPLTPGDSITIIATDRAGNKSKPVVVKIADLGIAVTHPTRYRGEEQVVTGYNFNVGEKVDLVVYSDPFEAGSGVADSHGTVTITFIVPETMEYALHTATLTGDESGTRSATFQVIPRPVVPTGGTTLPGATLPLILMALGGLIAVIGGGILTRRQRSCSDTLL
ncbi:MAG: Ig-like domain-containing protein, partial [Propionibacteriaceae bacterium]|nr:Ig-like domain-containing protein [Propionibacteriaceae bacterium]